MKKMSEPRMYLVVNASLRLNSGKLAAQAAHAGHLFYKKASQELSSFSEEKQQLFHAWDQKSYAKITLGANKEEFEKLRAHAFIEVIDEGRTQIEKGTCTVLVMFPTEEPLTVLKDLKLWSRKIK